MRPFLNGLITGLIIQLAIGPVFFFITNIALQRTFYDGLAGAFAVTLVDYIYIALALFGVGKLLKKKCVKKTFGILSSIVLMIFGLFLIKNFPTENTTVTVTTTSNLWLSFSSVFFLAISNPMAIVWNTSLLTTKAIECNYSKHQLLLFGLAVGLSTFLVFGVAILIFSLLKTTAPMLLIQVLNGTVACLLIGYGGTRLLKILKRKA